MGWTTIAWREKSVRRAQSLQGCVALRAGTLPAAAVCVGIVSILTISFCYRFLDNETFPITDPGTRERVYAYLLICNNSYPHADRFAV
jgi:hypothetical protein